MGKDTKHLRRRRLSGAEDLAAVAHRGHRDSEVGGHGDGVLPLVPESSDLRGGHEEVAGELVGVDLRGGPPPTIRAQIHEHRIGLIGVADEVPDLVGQRERTTTFSLLRFSFFQMNTCINSITLRASVSGYIICFHSPAIC